MPVQPRILKQAVVLDVKSFPHGPVFGPDLYAFHTVVDLFSRPHWFAIPVQHCQTATFCVLEAVAGYELDFGIGLVHHPDVHNRQQYHSHQHMDSVQAGHRKIEAEEDHFPAGMAEERFRPRVDAVTYFWKTDRYGGETRVVFRESVGGWMW